MKNTLLCAPQWQYSNCSVWGMPHNLRSVACKNRSFKEAFAVYDARACA